VIVSAAGFGVTVVGLLFGWATAAGIELGPFAAGARFRLDDLLGMSLRLDGVLAGACAFSGLLLTALVRRLGSNRYRVLVAGLGSLVLALALLQFEMIMSADRALGGLVSPGIGLWLVAGGALASIAGALLAGRRGGA
jgi:hypothetical protein